MPNRKKPPSLARKLLQILISSDLMDEIEGDLLEVYHWRINKKGNKYARFRYYLDVFSAIRFIKVFSSILRNFNRLSPISVTEDC